MPLAVVRLDVPAGGDRGRGWAATRTRRAPTTCEWRRPTLETGAAAAMPADWVVDGDRPVGQVVDEVLGRLGWLESR